MRLFFIAGQWLLIQLFHPVYATAPILLSYFSRVPDLPSARHIILIHKLKSKAAYDFVDVFLVLSILRENKNKKQKKTKQEMMTQSTTGQ